MCSSLTSIMYGSDSSEFENAENVSLFQFCMCPSNMHVGSGKI